VSDLGVVPASAVIPDDARELYARMAGLGEQPGPDDDASLHLLLSLGLVRQDVSEGYLLVDPQYVGARWEGSFYTSAARMLEQAATVSEALRPLRHAFDNRSSESAGLIEYHRGSEAINWRVGQVLGGCSSELLVCQPGGPRRPEILQETAQRDLETLNRGVAMKTIYHDHARAGASIDDWVKVMTDAGAEIRTLDEKFERMFIIDRRIAVVPGDDILTTSSDAVAYIVNDSGVARFLARQFERDWNRARAWSETAKAEVSLTGRQAAVLRGLAAGDGQQLIARRLKISQRTMADTISELKALYNVTSLFQLACSWTSAGGV
jgi:DNA-binding CsgD family transcriptional regulator